MVAEWVVRRFRLPESLMRETGERRTVAQKDKSQNKRTRIFGLK